MAIAAAYCLTAHARTSHVVTILYFDPVFLFSSGVEIIEVMDNRGWTVVEAMFGQLRTLTNIIDNIDYVNGIGNSSHEQYIPYAHSVL